MRSLIPLSLLLAVLDTPVRAIIVPFNVHLTRNPFTSLTRRTPVTVGNTGNAQYVANISIAGNPVPVLLDTGSSDLWVHFAKTPSNAASISDTGAPVSLAYAVGTASGNAQRAKVEFGGYAVDDQAFLLVNDASSFTGDIRSQGYHGLFGLGPNSGSVVRKKLNKKNADTMLQNIFNHANLSSNYITFLLDRKNDLGDPFKGQMSIAEVIPGFENITSMPKLDVETVTRLLKSDQHWQALTDKDNGITGPDGKTIPYSSIVPRAPDGQLVAVIDSGFTFSQVPREVADAIYGRVKGAAYDSANEWWLVPCGQYINVAFNFGGRSYPVHPLDVVDDNFSKIDGSGRKVCIGSFQPITSAFSLLGHYDMILGMSFLRSVYTLLNFGSWIDNGNQENPYVQMSSHTDVKAARAEFVQLRLSGVDTIDSDTRWALLPASEIQKSPVSDEEKKKKYQEMVLSRWPYILLGCLVFTIGLVGFCIWRCCRRRRNNRSLALNKRLGFPSSNRGARGAKDEDLYHADTKEARASGGSYLPLETPYPKGSPASQYSSTQDLTSAAQAPAHGSEYPQFPQQSYNTHANEYRSSDYPPQAGYPPQSGYPQQQYPPGIGYGHNVGYAQGDHEAGYGGYSPAQAR